MNEYNIVELFISFPIYIKIIISICIICIFVCLFIFRSNLIIKKITKNAIILAETKFNSGEGQQKLEYAVNYIQNKLPFILKFIITKKILINIIEITLQKCK